jgi:hypothetical protein
MADMGEAGGGDEADVASADHSDAHAGLLLIRGDGKSAG